MLIVVAARDHITIRETDADPVAVNAIADIINFQMEIPRPAWEKAFRDFCAFGTCAWPISYTD